MCGKCQKRLLQVLTG